MHASDAYPQPVGADLLQFRPSSGAPVAENPITILFWRDISFLSIDSLFIYSYFFRGGMITFLMGMKWREKWAYYLEACGANVGCW